MHGVSGESGKKISAERLVDGSEVVPFLITLYPPVMRTAFPLLILSNKNPKITILRFFEYFFYINGVKISIKEQNNSTSNEPLT